MAKRKAGTKKAKQATDDQNGGVVALTKELFQAAITLRGSVEPADYKRYVLPIIFLRFLSLRYDRRRAELEALVADKKSDYFGDKKAIHDPDEYRRMGAFVIPEAARWENLRKAAQADDIKVKLDDVLRIAREQVSGQVEGASAAHLRGIKPRCAQRARPHQSVQQGHLRNANTMWMLHFLSHLKDSGTAGFVMASGELSNGETARLEVRKALVEHDYVDCIVQLTNQFFANTAIPCSLWPCQEPRQ